MKDKLVYLLAKMIVKCYEATVTRANNNFDKYECIQKAIAFAQVLSEIDDVKYIALSNRLAKVNYVALVDYFSEDL